MDIIKQLMKEFEYITGEIIKCIENGEFEHLKPLLDKRQDILNTLEGKKDSKAEIINACNNTNSVELGIKAIELTEDKLKFIKEELRKIDDNRHMRSSYRRQLSENTFFLNKKI